MVTWSCLGFPFELVPTSIFLSWTLTEGSHSKTIVSRVSHRIGILRLVKCVFCRHLFVASLLLCICSPNPWVLFSGVWFCCWMSSSATRVPGVFGGQALPLIRLSCRCVVDVMLLHCVCCTRLIRTRINAYSVNFHLLLSDFNVPELRLQLVH